MTLDQTSVSNDGNQSLGRGNLLERTPLDGNRSEYDV
jgi:hypothetical protein